jgi:hypothetical protein
MPKHRTDQLATQLHAAIRRPKTVEQLAKALEATPRQLENAAKRLEKRGFLVERDGERWRLETGVAPGGNGLHELKSDRRGEYVIGFASDQHLCSKYERLDVLGDLYRKFAERGVRVVANCGNWIDGESHFNKWDIHTHGMDAQLRYLAEHYPAEPGLTTYAIAGEDHEGWYGRREGVDIGRHAEIAMREAGRKDWKNLGFMEAFISLRHCTSGESARMLMTHPGGGSSYAVSYRPQKIVESFEGGEKPAVLLIGHYHKQSYNVFRNVHCVQTGCTQDQTPFMRKKGLQAHIGGGILELTQCPKTGAITRARVEFFQYFNRGYYNDRWSQAGPATMPRRSQA